jgi:peroxiredoxin
MAVSSTMLPLGTTAPDFRLPDTRTGKIVSLSDFAAAPAFLAVFTCNHCPYAMHVKDAMVALLGEYQAKGLAVVAISSNDIGSHPQDGPAEMAKLAAASGFTFPYLYDESQDIATAYHAACTPDFFLFDRGRTLVYRGQMDGSRPGNNVPLTGADLRAALDAVLAGRPVSGEQKPSIGCGIKWKPGKGPGAAR